MRSNFVHANLHRANVHAAVRQAPSAGMANLHGANLHAAQAQSARTER